LTGCEEKLVGIDLVDTGASRESTSATADKGNRNENLKVAGEAVPQGSYEGPNQIIRDSPTANALLDDGFATGAQPSTNPGRVVTGLPFQFEALGHTGNEWEVRHLNLAGTFIPEPGEETRFAIQQNRSSPYTIKQSRNTINKAFGRNSKTAGLLDNKWGLIIQTDIVNAKPSPGF
jgi:hypothetical protein